MLKIIDIIKSNFKSIYGFNYLLLDNINTIKNIYDVSISKLVLYHNISKNVIMEIIENMINENNYFTLLKHKNDIYVKYSDGLNIINITFTTDEIFSRGETIDNIYYSITDDKLIFYEDNFIFIDDYKKFISELSDNKMTFLEIIKYYLITNEESLRNIIFEIIAKSDLDKLNIDNNSFLIEYLNFLLNINENQLFDRFILFINETLIFNKILFGDKEFNFFGYENLDLDTYLKLLLINKIEFITKDYIKYIKNNNELDDFEMLSEDKLLIYRKLKKQRKDLDIIPNNLKLITKNINVFYIMMKILFYVPPDNTNIETLKYAYIYKCFNQKDLNEIKINFQLFNKMLENHGLENYIKDDNYLFIMFFDNYLCKYEYESYSKIPGVHKKLQCGDDQIDIDDFQDAFVLVFEYVYLNKFEFTSYEQTKEICDDLINSVLCSIRANKLISNVKEVEFCSNETNNDFEEDMNNVLFQIIDNENNGIDNEIVILDDEEDSNKKNYKKKYDEKKAKYKNMKNIMKIIKNNYFDIELIKDVENEKKIDIISSYYNLISNDINETLENYILE